MIDWYIFFGIVIVILALDLGIFNKKDKIISPRKSIIQSIIYLSIGAGFSFVVLKEFGHSAMNEYLTGFIIEKTLSLDNIFLISVIFSYFKIPQKYQHKILFWGILGVIVLRGILIYLGAELVHKFEWIMFVFGLILIATGIKMLFVVDKKPDIANNFLLNLIKRFLPLTNDMHNGNFTVLINGKRYFTPLFVSLALIEFCDLIFAIDSVPAIFSITTNTYVIYTSNIFAILGLRALYFAINVVVEKFKYVKYSLSLVLVFIGSKPFITYFMEIEKFPASISLSVTIGLIAAGILTSYVKTNASRS